MVCTVRGKLRSILRFERALKQETGRENVTSDLPECTDGCALCTAVFTINAGFVDVTKFSNYKGLYFKFDKGSLHYEKQRGKLRGDWISTESFMERQDTPVITSFSRVDEDDEADTLDDFEDLEMWEARHYGTVD